MTVVMIFLGTLSCLGYGPLADITVIGMQFLDFFDFLTNSVMMPIAAIATCLLVSRVIGVEKIENRSYRGRPPVQAESHLPVHDQIPLPDLCRDHSCELRGECVWVDLDVTVKKSRAILVG